jgi:catechol 2,3-dioxygenase-like lactoylglutathione lyase family enzyme
MAQTSELGGAEVIAVLPAIKLATSIEFYRDTLGLKVEDRPDSPGYAFVHGGNGTRLLLYERGVASKAEHTAAALGVGDFDSAISELKGRGAKLEEYDLPGLKTVDGVAKEPNGSRSAWVTDPAGNIIAITEETDVSAGRCAA